MFHSRLPYKWDVPYWKRVLSGFVLLTPNIFLKARCYMRMIETAGISCRLFFYSYVLITTNFFRFVRYNRVEEGART